MALGLDGDALDRSRYAGSGQRLPLVPSEPRRSCGFAQAGDLRGGIRRRAISLTAGERAVAFCASYFVEGRRIILASADWACEPLLDVVEPDA